ncbi:uncharacterized protein LOC107760905 [Nicotiana tabacum]|uniref:Uncharacterized protein LOC107760905 n=1 Tax=Nicotiana tabacum TaxID=4097 RepID=A0AC58SEU9_TOBAC
MMRRQQDQQSKVFYELSSLILNILRSPPGPIDESLAVSPSSSGRRTAVAGSMQHITPAGFASLLLGISFALMLCGSVTFFIGFLMMPWPGNFSETILTLEKGHYKAGSMGTTSNILSHYLQIRKLKISVPHVFSSQILSALFYAPLVTLEM